MQFLMRNHVHLNTGPYEWFKSFNIFLRAWAIICVMTWAANTTLGPQPRPLAETPAGLVRKLLTPFARACLAHNLATSPVGMRTHINRFHGHTPLRSLLGWNSVYEMVYNPRAGLIIRGAYCITPQWSKVDNIWYHNIYNGIILMVPLYRLKFNTQLY